METYMRILSVLICYLTIPTNADKTVLSSVLKPEAKKTNAVQRTARSYYDPRLHTYPAYPRPLYERLEDDRPRCGRCMEDRYDEDYDRRRGYDDDRRSYERRPAYNRYDTSKYDRNRDEDYTARRPSERKNGTNGNESSESKDDKKMYDDKEGDRRVNPNLSRDRNRYDERDRVRPDYNDRDRYYRDPYRDPYRERNPYEDRRPYERYDEAYPGRGVEGFGYRRPVYEDGFDRGNGYDDSGYGSYSPSAGRGPHDSFRPWDETYRGTSGFDAGGRGYYFASGRPDPGPGGWGRLEYDRPAAGWQDVGYPAYHDPYERGVAAYQDPYRQDPYRQELIPYRPSGWHSVNERKPQGNGVYRQSNRNEQPGYGQNGGSHGQSGGSYGQNTGAYGQNTGAYGQGGGSYGQNTGAYGQGGGSYGQGGGSYGQGGGSYGQGSSGGSYGQTSNRGPTNSNNSPTSTSTTPGNSYLYDRDDNHTSSKADSDSTTKSPS